MKILWLSHLVPYPPKGGILQRSYHLLHEVSRYHEVDLLAFHQPNLMQPLFPDMESGLAEARSVLGEFCTHIDFVDIDSDIQPLGMYRLAFKSLLTKDPYTINWLKSGTYTERLKALLRDRRYDLVHLDTISLLPYFSEVRHLPAVLDHHNIESHMLLRRAENEENALKKWYFKQEGTRLESIEAKFCPEFSLNITCSDIDKNRLETIAPASRVQEIPNGVDIQYFKPDPSVKQNCSLIFIGTLSWYPNIEAVRFIAQQLWPELKQAIPQISIDIIGAKPPEDIQQLGEQDVHFNVHGFVDDILPYLDRAAIYICPIMDGGGTKLKILDALSMGKAIVAHTIACEGIEVENGKNVLFAHSVDEYIDAIKQLLSNEGLRREMGQSARRLIEDNYAYESVGKKLSAAYEQCVQAHTSKSA